MNEYIQQFPPEIQARLFALRDWVLQQYPMVDEHISYGLPTFKINGKTLLHFGAFKHHIGVYALPHTHAAFADALSAYKNGKGSVQFPHTQPFPLALIGQMIMFRYQSLDNSIIPL